MLLVLVLLVNPGLAVRWSPKCVAFVTLLLMVSRQCGPFFQKLMSVGASLMAECGEGSLVVLGQGHPGPDQSWSPRASRCASSVVEDFCVPVVQVAWV